MSDEIDTIDYFINEVLIDAEEIGILVTPEYDENKQETFVQYDVIETSDSPASPHLDIRQELEADQSLAEVYLEECERLEEEFPEADIHYIDNKEKLTREMPYKN